MSLHIFPLIVAKDRFVVLFGKWSGPVPNFVPTGGRWLRLSAVSVTNKPLDPLVLLLSYLEDVGGERYTKRCITFTLYYDRREILLGWKSEEPPTCTSWRHTVNLVLPLYKITYESRQCPKTF